MTAPSAASVKLVALLLALLLAGCAGAPSEGGSSSEPPASSSALPLPGPAPLPSQTEESSSQESSEEEALPALDLTEFGLPATLPQIEPFALPDGTWEMRDPRAPADLIETLCRAMELGDRVALDLLGEHPNDDALDGLVVERASWTATEDPQIFVLSLFVTEPGATWLLRGENACLARVGTIPYGEHRCISSLRPVGEPRLELDTEDSAYHALELLRGIHSGALSPFENPADLDRAALADALVLLARFETEEDRYTFTQEEVDAMALRYFGLSGIDGTGLRFYDAETGLYEHYGRGGDIDFDRLVSAEETSEGDRIVTYEHYADGFKLAPRGQTSYCLRPNGDGSFRFVWVRETA